MERFGIPLDTTLRIRAVGVDSQAGNPSPEAIFHLENSLFDLQDLPTEKGSQQVAVGDVDGDRRDDLVVVNSYSDQLRVYRYDGSWARSRSPLT